MELECVISNQMKDYRCIHRVKFQDHITNNEMARACIMDTCPRKYVWTGLFHIVLGSKVDLFRKLGILTLT